MTNQQTAERDQDQRRKNDGDNKGGTAPKKGAHRQNQKRDDKRNEGKTQPAGQCPLGNYA